MAFSEPSEVVVFAPVVAEMVLKGWGTFGVCLVSPPTHYLPNTWVDEKKIGRLVDCDPHYLLVAYRCSRGNCVQLAPKVVPLPVPPPPHEVL